MKISIKTYELDEKVLALCIFNNEILYGGTNKHLKTLNDNKILYTHSKSIRTISSSKNFFGSGSYDCTSAIFKNFSFVDLIEGPETEIKGIAFSEDEKFIALSTRGKTVWVCNIKDNLDRNAVKIEMDAVIEDHYQDVKGVKFIDGLLYSYGYDNRLLIYERLDIDDNWECINCIEFDSTIWAIDSLNNKIIIAEDNGNLTVINKKYKTVFKIQASMCPIYSVVSINNKYFAFVLNLKNIGIINENGELVDKIENLGNIYSLAWNEVESELVCGGDKFLKIIKIRFS